MSSSKNHFLMIDGVKMRSKKSAGTSKRKNDKAIASDSTFHSNFAHKNAPERRKQPSRSRPARISIPFLSFNVAGSRLK
jgi:hypothetical protein